MQGFLYFFPGRSTPATTDALQPDLDDLGLGDVLRGVNTQSRKVEHGPGGGAGMLAQASDGGQCKYLPDSQTWFPNPSVMNWMRAMSPGRVGITTSRDFHLRAYWVSLQTFQSLTKIRKATTLPSAR